MKPIKLTKSQLLKVLQDITNSIENNDSFEGWFKYSCLEEECKQEEFMCHGSYRIGNLNGQGGCILIGLEE